MATFEIESLTRKAATEKAKGRRYGRIDYNGTDRWVHYGRFEMICELVKEKLDSGEYRAWRANVDDFADEIYKNLYGEE